MPNVMAVSGPEAASASASAPITALLDKADAAAAAAPDDTVTVGEVLRRLGPRSFSAVVLLVAMVASTPVSGLPGATSVASLIIGTLLWQMLRGADEIWLPRWIRRRRVKTGLLTRATGFLRRPVGVVEPMLRPRLVFLTRGPARKATILFAMALTVVMPILDFLPLTGSLAALTLAFLAAGLLAQDGLFVLVSILWTTGCVTGLVLLLT